MSDWKNSSNSIVVFIIWLANFASFDWPIPVPITYGTDLDLLFLVFVSFVRCLVVFTNEMANHFVFDKGSLGLEIRMF